MQQRARADYSRSAARCHRRSGQQRYDFWRRGERHGGRERHGRRDEHCRWHLERRYHEEFDEAYLEFAGVDESVVWQAKRFTNQNATSGWVAFEASTSGLDLLRGQTITFVAYSRTDLSGKTSFFLDSLRLVATCGR